MLAPKLAYFSPVLLLIPIMLLIVSVSPYPFLMCSFILFTLMTGEAFENACNPSPGTLLFSLSWEENQCPTKTMCESHPSITA